LLLRYFFGFFVLGAFEASADETDETDVLTARRELRPLDHNQC